MEENAAEDQAAQADERVAGGARRLAQLDERVRGDPSHRDVFARQEDDEGAARQDHAALEAAAGRHVPVRGDVSAQDEHGRDECEREAAKRVARAAEAVLVGLLTVRRLALAAHRAQQDHHADDGAEQDELLAERVERPVIEVDGGDEVGGVALTDADAVQHVAVRARVVAEPRQPSQAVHNVL